MSLTEEDKNHILSEFLRIILHISDKEYQKRVWIRGEGPEVNDFDETICHFFDDGDPILKNYKIYGISENQQNLLQEFRKLLKSFSDENYWPPMFIDSPEWTNITIRAKEVLQSFNYSK
ncbi:MAG: hypothetical protein K2P51_07410 [Rhabdochlamydiaceae bacterium]|nr:hypothetical protein [Rhabdochlamydiaceae bacterium]